MKNIYLPISFLLLFILLFVPFLSSKGQVKNDYAKIIQRVIKDEDIKKIDQILKGINIDHPDYPALLSIKALLIENKGNGDAVISILEELRKKTRYQVIENDGGDSSSKVEIVGHYNSFALWRELSYLLLGRNYYEKKYYKESFEAFSGIPETSPFYEQGYYGKIWSALALKKPLELSDIKIFSGNEVEGLLQKAYFHHINNDFASCMKITDEIIHQNKNLPKNLESVAFKLYSESAYKFWPFQEQSHNFEDNINHLKKVIATSERISSQNLDPEVLFFKAEAYWDLATIYRIEDPNKYEKESKLNFQKAWIPLENLMKETLQNKKAKLREEAYFLGVVVLLELEKYNIAIPYLSAHKDIYPSGRYREDIHQLLGDYYFDKQNFNLAKDEYRRLITVASPEKATYGSYKAAWSFYNLGKKWPALRQMEKIILHLKNENINNVTPDKRSSIMKESRRDMLLFMAELMNAETALKELQIFENKGLEKIDTEENLASTYKNIGKFDDSNIIFEKLLNEFSIEESYSDHMAFWLKELIDNDLRNAKRNLIPFHFKKYFPNIKSPSPKVDELVEYFAELILIIHREAKKSETIEIWEALDESYLTFEFFFPNSKEAKIWYHGAERFEMTKNLVKAKEWYKKAALIKEFEFKDDSAYSFLSLMKDESDQLSLKRVTDPVLHQKVATEVKWYIDNFSHRQERHYADEIYLEHLLHANNFNELKNYFSTIIKADNLIFENKRKIKKIQSLLTQEKKWDELSKLVDVIIQNIDDKKIDEKFYNDLLLLTQESAFQFAFNEKDITLSREWYQKAIRDNSSLEVTLKSYHNLLLSFKENELSSFESILNDLPEETYVQSNTKDYKSLISGIWLYKANLHKQNNDLVSSADSVLHAFEIQGNLDKSFDVLLIYGAFHEMSKFDSLYGKIIQDYPTLLESEAKLINIARIYFENDELSKSFEILGKIFTTYKNDLSSSFFLFLRDFSFYVFSQNKSLKDNFLKLFKENEGVFLEQPILTQVFDYFLYPDFDISSFQELNLIDDLDGDSQNSSEKLLHYVNSTAKNISTFNEKIETFKPFFDTKGLLTKEKIVCLIPELRNKLISSLNYYLKNEVSHKNWNDFKVRIEGEITKLNSLKEKEINTCSLLGNANSIIKKECTLSSCYNFNAPSENDFKNDSELANHGATFYLQLMTFETKIKSERFYIQGLIRLHYQDSLNAKAFFDECIKENDDFSVRCKEVSP